MYIRWPDKNTETTGHRPEPFMVIYVAIISLELLWSKSQKWMNVFVVNHIYVYEKSMTYIQIQVDQFSQFYTNSEHK